MSFNDSFAGYLLFEIMMRVLNNKIEKMKKAVNIDYAPVTINRYINVMKKLEKAILENPQRVALARQTPLTLLAKIRIPPVRREF